MIAPNLMYVILSYNRPTVLAECLRTLLKNTTILPDLIYILDDNSLTGQKEGLLNFSGEYSSKIPVHVVLNGINLGVGHQFQTGYNLIKQHNPRIVGIIESDYIFRSEFMEDIDAVWDACPYTVAIPGCDHLDMRKPEKYYGEF